MYGASLGPIDDVRDVAPASLPLLDFLGAGAAMTTVSGSVPTAFHFFIFLDSGFVQTGGVVADAASTVSELVGRARSGMSVMSEGAVTAEKATVFESVLWATGRATKGARRRENKLYS